MGLDRERYEREVIRPLRGRYGRLSDDDLVRRYAVDPRMGLADLRAHLRELRTFWNQKAGGADSKAQVCKQLLAADEELQRKVGAALLDPAWWRQQAQRGDEAARAAAEQLTIDLGRAYGATGQITRDQLAGIVAHYPALSQQTVDSAVKRAKMRVVDAAELPRSSGLDRTAYRELTQRLREVGVPTVVGLLYPELDRPFTLVRGFTVPGGPAVSLTPVVVDDRITTVERAADSPMVRARKAALRILRTGLAGGADLRTIAIFQIVEQLAADRAAGLADALLLRQATRLGLTEADAALVVASLPSGVETGSTAAAKVRELLGDGQLRQAQQAVALIPTSDPERDEVEQAVAARLARFQQLLAEADVALRERREEEAERLLRDAQRVAADDEDLTVRLRRLPPPPPRELTAVGSAATVRLSWQPPDSAARKVRYRVVRAEGRPPVSPQDGVSVGETGKTTLTDSSPPVARDLRYGVFATAGGEANWSRAAQASAHLLPPIGEVRLNVDVDQVSAAWTAHPSVAEVRVRRCPGRPPAGPTDGVPVPASRTSLVDGDVREGTEYFYGLVAVYHDGQGREVVAATTVVSALPQAAARPLDGLAVASLAAAGDAVRVRLSWPSSAGRIRVRYAAAPSRWEFGEAVTIAQLETYGREAAGIPMPEGDTTALDCDVPAGPQIYLPFTLGGAGAVVGRPVEFSQTEPFRQLHARRQGSEVVLTWIWPADVRLADVEWSTPDRPVRYERISRTQYVDGQGCVLSIGPAGGAAHVRTVTLGSAGEVLSPPAVVIVPGRAIGLSYTLRRPGQWRARLSRRRIVEIHADQDCSGVELVVVVSERTVLPLRPDQGRVVDRFQGLRFAGGAALPLEIELPDGLRRPYWIRCFAIRPENVTMIDPPVAELRVS